MCWKPPNSWLSAELRCSLPRLVPKSAPGFARWKSPHGMLSIHFQGLPMGLGIITASSCPPPALWNGSTSMVCARRRRTWTRWTCPWWFKPRLDNRLAVLAMQKSDQQWSWEHSSTLINASIYINNIRSYPGEIAFFWGYRIFKQAHNMILRRETSWEVRHIWRSYHHRDVNYVQWFMATIGLFFCWYSRFSILKSDDEFNLLPYFFRWLDTTKSHCTDFRCNQNSYFQDWNIRRVIKQPGTWGPWWTVNFLVSHGPYFSQV